MTQPHALITGIAGQDGAYLTKLLLEKDYRVTGFDVPGTQVAHVPGTPSTGSQVEVLYGDIREGRHIRSAIKACQPTEIYHLAGRTHAGDSFAHPDEALATNYDGTLNLLEAVAITNPDHQPRLFLASSCEIFGSDGDETLDEKSTIAPVSPYGRSKALAFEAACEARKSRELHLSNGILFNHESPLRPETFVSRKITKAVARIGAGGADDLSLGNLSARRDWGHAADYADAMWRMLQQPTGDDYVVATGRTTTVRDLVDMAFAAIDREIDWAGEGASETGRCRASGNILVRVDPELYRPLEAPLRMGNASKARERLGWEPSRTVGALIREMVEADRARFAETNLAVAR